MAYSFSMENRPLKKQRLGPPDVYPQDKNQKEDELTPVNVKQGFSHTPNLNQAEEYGSAKTHNFSLAKVQNFINGVLTKKQEINTLLDTGKKRQLINPKENFHNVTPKSKAFIESWFKDLAGCKPLINLGKRVPIFNKKEEIFIQLSEYQVPMVRAIWLIKMTSAYSVAISEAKMKKRQVPDSSQEWTSTLVRFIKEQLMKLQEFYQKSQSGSSLLALHASNAAAYHNGSPLMNDEQKLALRQFNYCQQLCKVMFEEGLLECQDFLQWQLDMLERCKTCDDGLLRLVIPFILQYVEEFTQCEILSRKLVFQICKRITPMLPNDQNSDKLVTIDVGSCDHHRSVLIQMSAIIQTVVLHCPAAVVWNYVGEGKVSSHLVGSPLDQLPHPPSALPMAPRFSNDHVRQMLREAEVIIKQRSRAAELRWPLDVLNSELSPNQAVQQPQHSKQPQSQGIVTTRVLQVLEALDRHSFDRVDLPNNIDSLYNKIFPSIAPTKVGTDSIGIEQVKQLAKQDDPIIRLLCQWAVSDQRNGEHRALAAAQLLEKRQADLIALVENDATNTDDNDTDESTTVSITQPLYQNFLIKFLDSEAPTLNEPGTAPHSNRTVFASLVHLFYELIKHEVFSHDMYMCTLISRGDLLSVTPNNNGTSSSSTQVHLAGPPTSGMNSLTGFQSMNDLRSEMDDSKIDDDLGKLLQHIKEEHYMDAPDSPKDENPQGNLDSSRGDKEGKRQSRHLLFTTHFPLPQDDALIHDCNQRHILLYGVGKAREESRHGVKKITKEISRLFHKKLAVDVQAEGTTLAGSGGTFGGSSKSRKHSSKLEFNFEQNMQRFLSLSYFDRHAVAAQAATACMEMISSFVVGGSAYLPILEHISFLFDMFEVSLSISGLIDLCLQLLKELPEVELLLSQRNSILSRSYLTNVGLYVVGVLRRFHCCLLLSPEQTTCAFESLCKIVKHVSNPADCSSAERCILAYLYDLYSCCSFLKVKGTHLDPQTSIGSSGRDSSGRNSSGATIGGGSEVFAFSNAYPKIKQTIFAPVVPSTAVLSQNREFLQEYIVNPRRKPEPHVLRQLFDSAQLRYSFVCNVVVAVCNEVDNDRLNDIALLCAELTAGCSALSAEWLGVLTALCYSASTYIDVLTQVDVQDNAIHHNLAVLFSVLLARHCFGLQDFLLYVGVPSLVKIWNEGSRSEADPEAEAGARLTCHLVLRLFKTSDAPHPACYSNSNSHSVNASPHHTLQQSTSTSLGVKLACDRHLLAATHNSISVGPVLAVLKAILVLADRVPAEGKGRTTGNNISNTSSRMSGTATNPNEVSISHILGTSWSGDLDLDMGSSNFATSRNSSGGNSENVTLATYARYVLKQICSQPWVHQRCLQNPEELLKPDGLLDSCLSFRQAQRLLQMISRPDSACAVDDVGNMQQDYKQVVNRVLDSLDQWRLRVAWLDLQLLCQQLIVPGPTAATSGTGPSPLEMNQLLDAVAKAVVDVFELSQPQISVKEETDQSGAALKKRAEVTSSSIPPTVKPLPTASISLIAPLVSKLPSNVQGRILKVASQVLESCNWSPPKMKEKERGVVGSNTSIRSKPLLSFEPLLSLIMTCLKGQDEQREQFLSSLHSQLTQFMFLPKEDRLFQCEDIKARQTMLEALQLRFSLVGGLFDSILRNPTLAIDWAVLMVQLVTSGVIDLTNNSELFVTLQDMTATLLHSTLVSDSQSDRSEDSRKYYPMLIKKLKKELAERKSSSSIQSIKQLLPPPKLTNEFVTCEPYGTLTDPKGNKISGFDSNDKKQGHRLHEKQRVSPWEILEGHKTVAPLSWAWFGAVRIERKPLRHQEVQRLLRHHTHSMQKPASYFLEHPSLPPEELEPPVIHEKIQPKEEVTFKMEIPMSDQSPRGATKRGAKTNQRRPRGRRGAAAAAAAAAAATVIPQPPVGGGGYQSPAASGMFPPTQPPQWSNYTPAATPTAQQAAVPTPAGFFPHQGVSGPRFPAERPGTQSRQALSNMLRQRHPTASAQFVPGQGAPPSGTPSNVPTAVTGGGPGGPPVSGAGVGGMGVSRGAGAVGQQPPFSNMTMPDKQRQQQFMRQQMRQPHASGAMFGAQGQQQQPPSTPQPQQQVPMAQGGFPNMHAPMNQNFNMFQGGQNQQPGMHVASQQAQPPPQISQQQGIMGQHFNQGGNFSMQQQQSQQQAPQANVQMQQPQTQGRNMNPNIRPFMQSGTMPMNTGQPNQFARGAMNNPNQQAVRLQHQMVSMQQQQQQQQQQHMGGGQQQHYQQHQQF